jgi:uroporphyrinogen-III decarboxylase
MNSKERVQAALKLQVPDKIPYGEYAIDFDTVEKIIGHETYLRAKAKCQIAFWEGRRNEVVQSWKEDTVELYKKTDCLDIVNLAADACGLVPSREYIPIAQKKIDENSWEDAEGKVFRYSETTKDITLVYDPKKWDREYAKEEFEHEVLLKKPDESIFEVVDYVIQKLENEKFIIGPSGREAALVLLGGMDRGLMEYALNPDIVKAATKLEVKIGNFEDTYFIRKGTDAILWGQDFSYNLGPMISQDMFKEFILPAAKQRVDNIKNKFGLPVIKHACGNNWAIMDMFIEIGYTCYQSIQDSSTMDIKTLKEKYGDSICLWGGIPVEKIISGTKEDIRKAIKYVFENVGVDRRLILGSSHSIAVGTNYENFMTIIDEIQKLR